MTSSSILSAYEHYQIYIEEKICVSAFKTDWANGVTPVVPPPQPPALLYNETPWADLWSVLMSYTACNYLARVSF